MPERTGIPDEWSNALAATDGVLLAGETLDEILELEVSLARSSLQRADGVGISLIVGDDVTTAACSDPFVKEMDYVQYETGQGPCMEAMRTRSEVEAPNLMADKRWPEFVRRTRDRGVAAVLSFPLTAGEEVRGALNVYSREEGPWTDLQRNTLSMFAKQASLVLISAKGFADIATKTTQLQEALRSREVIGIAKGILIEREAVTDEEAFDMLRRVSQNTNTKLRDVAQQIVDSAGKH